MQSIGLFRILSPADLYYLKVYYLLFMNKYIYGFQENIHAFNRIMIGYIGNFYFRFFSV